MNLFIKELKNDIQTWQLLHEVNICQILSRLESQRDKFRFHDQLRINKEKHFHIYPTDETNIIDIYVEPHYEIVSTNSNKIIIGSNFVDDSLGLLDKQRCLFISGSYGCGKNFTLNIFNIPYWEIKILLFIYMLMILKSYAGKI